MKKILILIIVLSLALYLASNLAIKSIIGTVSSSVTGAPTKIGGLSLDILKQTIRISDFKMYNPKGFPKDILIDMPNIGVIWDIGELLKGKIYLKELTIEINELGLTRNKDGLMNVDSLKVVEQKSDDKKQIKPTKQLPIQIDVLNLAIGKVVNTDYSMEGPPVVKVFDINLKKTYKNITSIEQLAALVIAEPLKAAGIKGLKVYGAMMLTGVAALPLAAAFTLTGKDFAQESFNIGINSAYNISLEVLKTMGKITKEIQANSIISAKINGASVTVKFKKISEATTQIIVSARKFGLPKSEIASGVIYKISEQIQTMSVKR